MARHRSHRVVRAARSYTFEEVSTALGVSMGTVRAWAKNGLPTMKSRRPYLILGEALKDFLQAKMAKRKSALKPTELYCLTSKAPRTPVGMFVDCIPQTASTSRLMDLCEVCGGTCNRMISRAKTDHFREIFALAEKDRTTA